MLSSYRLMWVLVMFDLPVVESDERKEAQGFRNFLQDNGFEMAQYSVYLKFCSSSSQVITISRKIEANLPKGGKVSILQFTDKQFEKIISFRGKYKNPRNQNPNQYDLF